MSELRETVDALLQDKIDELDAEIKELDAQFDKLFDEEIEEKEAKQ